MIELSGMRKCGIMWNATDQLPEKKLLSKIHIQKGDR